MDAYKAFADRLGQLEPMNPADSVLDPSRSWLTVSDFSKDAGAIIRFLQIGNRAKNLMPCAAGRRSRHNYYHRKTKPKAPDFAKSFRDLAVNTSRDLETTLSNAVQISWLMSEFTPELAKEKAIEPFNEDNIDGLLMDFYQPICEGLPCDFSLAAVSDDPHTLFNYIPVALQGFGQWDHWEIHSNYYDLLKIVAKWYDAVYMAKYADSINFQVNHRKTLREQYGIVVPDGTIGFDLVEWIERTVDPDSKIAHMVDVALYARATTGHWLIDYSRHHMAPDTYYYGPVVDWPWSRSNFDRLTQLWDDCKDTPKNGCKLAKLCSEDKSGDLLKECVALLRAVAEAMGESQDGGVIAKDWAEAEHKFGHMVGFETEQWDPYQWHELHERFSTDYAEFANEYAVGNPFEDIDDPDELYQAAVTAMDNGDL